MGDKYARISNFIKKGDFQFKEESIKDTLMDMAIYSLITIILYEEEMFDNHDKQFEEGAKRAILNTIEEEDILFIVILYFIDIYTNNNRYYKFMNKYNSVFPIQPYHNSDYLFKFYH